VITAILFDIDDTIVDFRSATVNGLRRHLSDVVGELPPEELAGVQRTWSELDSLHFGRYLAGELTFQEQRRARARDLCARHGFPLGRSAAEQDAWMAGYLVHCEASFTLFPDVVPALDRLEGAGPRIGAMSNSNHAYQDRKLRMMGIRDRFEVLVCCDDLNGLAKPDPRTFLGGCAAIGSAAEDTVYVGDRRDSDAVAATRAGLRGVWLDRLDQRGTDMDVERVGDLGELADLVLREYAGTGTGGLG
jgi:putative hydrolase of the HAD superfamily